MTYSSKTYIKELDGECLSITVSLRTEGAETLFRSSSTNFDRFFLTQDLYVHKYLIQPFKKKTQIFLHLTNAKQSITKQTESCLNVSKACFMSFFSHKVSFSQCIIHSRRLILITKSTSRGTANLNPAHKPAKTLRKMVSMSKPSNR